jgi:hypothetical protein
VYQCKICGKKFAHERSLSGHVGGAHSNERHVFKKRIKIEKQCEKCSTTFSVVRTVNKNGDQYIPRNEKRFCSHRCANGHSYTNEWRAHISKSLTNNPKNPFYGGGVSKVIHICPQCNKSFEKPKHQKFCSKSCASRSRKKPLDETSHSYYWREAQFRFNLSDFPDEFDFSLIDKYGFYRAKNNGDNPLGVCRDHIVSVTYGFRNKIPPEIISHPANCQLLPHMLNIAKHTKSGMSVYDLYEKIKAWNSKYDKHI